jgi:signal transduction histidine kinase
MRTVNDIRILQAASWWTPERLGIAFGVASTVLLLTLGWVGRLRRQVDSRTAQLSHEMRERQNAKVKFEAVLQERVRLAADLHDSLEQSLTGAVLQLRAMELSLAEEPSAAPQNLSLVRQILDNSRDEVRRSVWGLRARALDNFSLDDALKEMARQIPSNSGANIEVHSEGQSQQVPDLIANHLLRVGQEALGNALKHGRATNIKITLRYEPDRVELTVVDDGTGFDSATCLGPAEGHFGLQGMRERAKRVGGVFELETTPGRGTRIRTAVNMPAK